MSGSTLEVLEYLRQMNVCSVMVRLTLAVFCGGVIGMERERKRRPAGFRTYMLVCLGAALTMLPSQYEFYMVTHDWSALAVEVGLGTDVSRFGVQVINGIGFLGAGTIIVTGHQEVKGLTTAAGLWAAAIIGLALGGAFTRAASLPRCCSWRRSCFSSNWSTASCTTRRRSTFTGNTAAGPAQRKC